MEYKILKLNKEMKQFEEVKVKGSVVTYEELKDTVGGWIEHVTFNRKLHEAGIDMWIDEEGKLKNLNPSIIIADDNHIIETLCGDIVFTRRINHDDNSYCLLESQIELIKDILKNECLIMYKSYNETKTDTCRVLEYK